MSKTSKRLKQASELVEKEKVYSLEEALELAKKTSTTKFKGSIEVHFNLGVNPKQSDQNVRGQVKLPHNVGKEVKVAAFVLEGKEKEAKSAGAEIIGGEELIKEIKSSGKTDFDVAVATPEMMPKLAMIAKLLGPRGLMPSPRSGTVTPDIAQAIEEIKAGRIDFKNDDSGNVHGVLGKADMETSVLKENFEAFLEAVKNAQPKGIKKEYIKTITLNATMGPGVRVENT